MTTKKVVLNANLISKKIQKRHIIKKISLIANCSDEMLFIEYLMICYRNIYSTMANKIPKTIMEILATLNL
jgi:hypothetical protein